MRRRVLLAGAVSVTPLALFGCATLLGVDTESVLADGGDASTSSADAGPSATGDAIVIVRDASNDGCASGQKNCAGTCVSTSAMVGCGDASSCAACSLPNVTSTVCDTTDRCNFIGCQPGSANCDFDRLNGCESDILAPKTCGSCDVSCGDAAPFCAPGGCTVSCPMGTSPCSGSCADLTSNQRNCGSCGTVCEAGANADPACASSACTIQCRPNFGDCDNNPANGCEPLVAFYQDNDGDGYGETAAAKFACSPPKGFSKVGGDCLDSDPNVHPGQMGYFGKGYTNASGSTSFDYDCDGTESEQPGFAHLTACSSCPASGYPAAAPARSGVGIDPYCGANQLLNCFPSGSVSGVTPAMASGSISGCSGTVATSVAIGCR